jgi:hypothetical protein
MTDGGLLEVGDGNLVRGSSRRSGSGSATAYRILSLPSGSAWRIPIRKCARKQQSIGHDLSCPLDGAWEFARAWPDGELIVFDDAGHKGSPAMNDQLRAVLKRLAT